MVAQLQGVQTFSRKKIGHQSSSAPFRNQQRLIQGIKKPSHQAQWYVRGLRLRHRGRDDTSTHRTIPVADRREKIFPIGAGSSWQSASKPVNGKNVPSAPFAQLGKSGGH